jgi:membrane protease YdiL (CAAX protease family)
MWHVVKAVLVAILFGLLFYIFSLAISEIDSINIPEQILLAISSTGSTLCATIYLLKKHPINYKLNNLKTNIRSIITWGFASGIAISILQFPYATILGRKEIKAKLFIPIDEGIEYIALLLFLSIIATPIIEEILFRLCVYKVLKNRYNILIGYAGTALLFSIMHTASILQSILFMISSIILTYTYEKTELIEASIVAHSIWNTAWFSSVYAYHLSSTI